MSTATVALDQQSMAERVAALLEPLPPAMQSAIRRELGMAAPWQVHDVIAEITSRAWAACTGGPSTDHCAPVPPDTTREFDGGILYRFGQPLSPQQVTVLGEVAKHGDWNAATECLGIAPKTARAHMDHAFVRLGAFSALHAFALLGWVRPGIVR